MTALDKDLQAKKSTLEEFHDITLRVLDYLPNVISGYEDKGHFRIYVSNQAGLKKFVRPINQSLFLEKKDFLIKFHLLKQIFDRIKAHETSFTEEENSVIDTTLYTIQQAIGAGLDLLVEPNSARKHVGNRFEDLIKVIFTSIGVSSKKIVLQIPYETEEGIKNYKCENDLILSPYQKVMSTSISLDEKEIVLSAKTTSKDRMGKLFIDKILLEKFVNHPQKVIAVFLNDVQRKENNNISYTLVSGLFMVYTKFLTKLDGIYYLDPPPIVHKTPYSDHMKRFSELLTRDLRQLLTS